MLALVGFEFVEDVCLGMCAWRRGMTFALITGFVRGSDREMNLTSCAGLLRSLTTFRKGRIVVAEGVGSAIACLR